MSIIEAYLRLRMSLSAGVYWDHLFFLILVPCWGASFPIDLLASWILCINYYKSLLTVESCRLPPQRTQLHFLMIAIFFIAFLLSPVVWKIFWSFMSNGGDVEFKWVFENIIFMRLFINEWFNWVLLRPQTKRYSSAVKWVSNGLFSSIGNALMHSGSQCDTSFQKWFTFEFRVRPNFINDPIQRNLPLSIVMPSLSLGRKMVLMFHQNTFNDQEAYKWEIFKRRSLK